MELTHVKEYHNGKLLIGDVLDRIKDIPNESVDCCLTSPPYWGLRDYGVAGQWGLEEDFRDYLKKMQILMNEIKRILKPTGTAWINLGDSYSGGYNHSDWDGVDERFCSKAMEEGEFKAQKKKHFEAKSRYGIPERFYVNCIDNGWIARNHIVWAKSNAMPTSVKDRFQNKWESIFFFSKNKKYFFNLDAVREKPISDYTDFNRRVRDKKKQLKLGYEDSPTLVKASEKELAETNDQGVFSKEWEKQKQVAYGDDDKGSRRSRVTAGLNTKGNHQPKGRSNFGTGRDIKDNMAKAQNRPMDFSKDYGGFDNAPNSAKSIKHRMAASRAVGADHDGCLNDPKGKNPGDIFNINPKPFVEAHFATFPIELPLKVIKCAVPEKVCKQCGMPVENIMQPTADYAELLGTAWHDHENDLAQGMQQKMTKSSVTASYEKVGEHHCSCNMGFKPGVVFDPFMGAGTVAMAAIELNRHWLGIELNPEYAELIDKRLKPKMNESLDNFGDEK